MKYMKAAEFKAKCLKIMEDLAAGGEAIVVTKRGRPVALVSPPPVPDAPKVGWGAGADIPIVYHGDIVGPIDTTDWTLDGAPWDELFPESTDVQAASEVKSEGLDEHSVRDAP